MTGYRLLVLDDDPDIHNLFEVRFEGTPFKLVFASDVEEARGLLLIHKFDCMLLDIVLGNNKSSADIIMFLKGEENSKNPDLPVIVMSSHLDSDYGDHIRNKESIIFNVLTKPIDKDINLQQLVDDTIHASIFLKG